MKILNAASFVCSITHNGAWPAHVGLSACGCDQIKPENQREQEKSGCNPSPCLSKMVHPILLHQLSQKWSTDKGLLNAARTSGKEAGVLCHHQWETGPPNKPLWIQTVRLSALQAHVSTPTALYQHLPNLRSAVQLKCWTICWFRVHGYWWESLGPRSRYLYNSCWFSSDKIRLDDNANLWRSN